MDNKKNKIHELNHRLIEQMADYFANLTPESLMVPPYPQSEIYDTLFSLSEAQEVHLK